MEINIQLEKNLITDDVIGTPVSDDSDIDVILGEIISYDTITGIAVCLMNYNDTKDVVVFFDGLYKKSDK